MTKKLVIAGFVILGILLAVATTSTVYFYYKQPAPGSGKSFEKAEEPKVVTKIKRVEVPGPTKIVTIEKQVIVEKLKLPDWVKNDPNEQAIAAAEIEPYEGKTDAVALLNTKSGSGQIIVKQQKLPFIGLENHGEVGARPIAYSAQHGWEAGMHGSWRFLRVGSVHTEVFGEVKGYKEDGKITGDAIVGAQVVYRW